MFLSLGKLLRSHFSPPQHFFLTRGHPKDIQSSGAECEEDKVTVTSYGKQRCRAQKFSNLFFSLCCCCVVSVSINIFSIPMTISTHEVAFLSDQISDCRAPKKGARGVMKNSRKLDQNEKGRGGTRTNSFEVRGIYLSTFRLLASFVSYLKLLARRFNERLWRGVSCINQVEEQLS
jgi:hypothetical protein